MMDILILSFYVACAVVPAGIVMFMIFRLIYRKNYQVILCMECDQCKRVCPMSRKMGAAFPGPMEILVAVKSGNVRPEIIAMATLCTSCGLCERACPRGLSPYKEIEKIKEAIPRAKSTVPREDISVLGMEDTIRHPFTMIQKTGEEQKRAVSE